MTTSYITSNFSANNYYKRRIISRSCLALDKKGQLLSNSKLQEKKMAARCRGAEDSLKHFKQLSAALQKEVACEKSKLETEATAKKVIWHYFESMLSLTYI